MELDLLYTSLRLLEHMSAHTPHLSDAERARLLGLARPRPDGKPRPDGVPKASDFGALLHELGGVLRRASGPR
jgi:hypothetical protein